MAFNEFPGDSSLSYDCDTGVFNLEWDNDIVQLSKEDVEFIIPKMQQWLDGF